MISPIDVATRGYLNSPLSVAADGYLIIGVPTPPEEEGGRPDAPMMHYADSDDIRERWERIMREDAIRRNDEDFIVLAVMAIKLMLGKL